MNNLRLNVTFDVPGEGVEHMTYYKSSPKLASWRDWRKTMPCENCPCVRYCDGSMFCLWNMTPRILGDFIYCEENAGMEEKSDDSR